MGSEGPTLKEHQFILSKKDTLPQHIGMQAILQAKTFSSFLEQSELAARTRRSFRGVANVQLYTYAYNGTSKWETASFAASHG